MSVACCPPLRYSFTNQSVFPIKWNADKIAVYGEIPDVQVYYQQDDGSYQLSEDENQVTYQEFPGLIRVDLGGGPFTGFIKVF